MKIATVATTRFKGKIAVALKNTQVMSGGLGGHDAESRLRDLSGRKIRFINISPIRDDLPGFLNHEWIPIRPCSDAALMLAVAHWLVSNGLYDRGFVERYTVGLEDFLPYLLGQTDGQPKDCRWASGLCDLEEGRIQRLAQAIAEERPMIGVSWSLQRAEHGEQTYWLATVLAALLGTHGCVRARHGLARTDSGSFEIATHWKSLGSSSVSPAS